MIIIFFLVLIFSLYNAKIEKCYLNPLTLLNSILSLQVIVYFVCIYCNYFYVIPINTCYCYLISIISFDLSYYATTFILKSIDKRQNLIIKSYKPKYNLLFHTIGIVGIFWLLSGAFRIYMSSPLSFFLAARNAALNNDHEYFGFGTHFVMMYQVYLLFKMVSNNIKLSLYIKLFVVVSIIISLCKMEKISLLIILPSLFCILEYKRINFGFKYDTKKLLILFMICLFIVVLFPILRNNSDFSYGLEHILKYFVKGIWTFEDCVYDKWIVGDYKAILGKFLYKIIPDLNIKYKIATIDGFNVYTYLAGMYVANGLISIILVNFLLGLIYSILYYLFRKGNQIFGVFYCFYIYPLILSFFSYTFALNNYLYYLLFICLLTCISSTKYTYKKIG